MTDHMLTSDRFPDDMSDSQIRSVLVDPPTPQLARLAFKTLSQRHSELAPVEARRILKDAAAVEELRASAAVELGRHPEKESKDALIEALRDAPHDLQRHIAKSLGQIGDLETLKALESVAEPDDPTTAKAVWFAKCLISYRLGSDAYLLKPDSNILEQAPIATEPTNVKFNDVNETEFASALPTLREDVPAITLDPKTALHFVCHNSDQWVVLNQAWTQTNSLSTVQKQPMVVGVLLRYRICSEKYSLDEYLLSNGMAEKENHITLLGVRPSGTIVHAGSISIESLQAQFVLQGVHPLFARPINLVGGFNIQTRRLSFSQMLVGTRRDAKVEPKVPRQM